MKVDALAYLTAGVLALAVIRRHQLPTRRSWSMSAAHQ
jgi:hypothetical protein